MRNTKMATVAYASHRGNGFFRAALFAASFALLLAFIGAGFSGCGGIIGGMGGGGGETEPPETEPPGTGIAEGAENMPSIKEKFLVEATGKDGVAAAFTKLHEFIQADGLDSRPGVINLGDWIDLEGGLTVAAYPAADGVGAIGTAQAPQENTQLADDCGYLLRLIVVGINSFHSGKGKDNKYTVTENDGTPHVVFQFQNVPVMRRMNPTDTSTGGYAASEMRAYLTDNFLAGLTAAGVPESVLWAPARYIANDGKGATGTDTLTDKLWLPTEREIFGSRTYSNSTYEKTANQARLEYYGKRSKNNGDSDKTWYWMASPDVTGAVWFCYVHGTGLASYARASHSGGCAPAFCVK